MLNKRQKATALRDLKELLEKGMPFPALASGELQSEQVIKFIEKLGEYMYPDMPEEPPKMIRR